ncbi:ABC transporter ATP-binding protein [Rubrobacter indicoceani]|uniref:ABC transporter ATP-binding protein n=1 Tax=Rubrobacter indicoceani TaxID=2051957 RepID=UPI000E5B4305|nr:ABC transporter ATP-binding protein [Rubrobacter indicoceani]
MSVATKIKDNSSVATFVNLWPYLKPEGRWMLLVVAATLGLTAVEILFPILIGKYIDMLLVQARGEPMPTNGLDGGTILWLLAGAAVLRGIFIFVQRAIAGRVGQKVSARMRDALWIHLQKLPVEYARRRGPGKLLVRFISDARAVQRLVSRGVVQLAQDVLVLAGVMAVLIYLDALMGLIALSLIPVIGLVFWLINPKIQSTSKDMRRRRSRLSKHLNDRVGGLEVIKSFGQARSEAKEVRRMNRNVVKYGVKREMAGGMLLGVSAGAVALVTVAVIAFASVEILGGRLTAGELLVFYALLGMLAPVFQRITVVDRTLQEAQISVQRFTETLDQPTEPTGTHLPKLEVTEGTVCVEDLFFRYPDGTPALEDVNFVARRGGLTVITGPNGAGKSTLMEILARFREPTAGRVTIDGRDMAEVSVNALRRAVYLVPCDAPLFDGTVRENVAYGSGGEIVEETFERAAELSGLGEVVASLHDGWETRVRAGRRDLSEGERQKVALARALAAGPAVILLDQAASAMDETSLQEISEKLRELSREVTVIVATLRLPAILAADSIYAMNGTAVEIDANELRRLYDAEGVFGVTNKLRKAAGIRRPPVRSGVARTGTRLYEDEDEDDED